MKKLLAILLSLAMLLGGAALAATEEDFTDIPDGWSHDAIIAAVDNGLMHGDGGKIDPQGTMTRAQAAALLVRAFGATKKSADISKFTDVDKNAWYYDELSVAVGIELFLGDGGGKLYPNDNITREQMAVVLARAFHVTDTGVDLSVYADSALISPWARDSVAALIKAGYMQGYDNKLGMRELITREQSAQFMHNIVAVYITEPGEYTFKTDGAVIVRVPGVVLKDCEIAGIMVLGDDLSREDVVLENTRIDGGLSVRSGEYIIDEAATPLGEAPAGEGGDNNSTNDGGSSSGGGGGGGFGGGTTTSTYALTIAMNSSVSVNTSASAATGLKGEDLFYLSLADHIKANAGSFKNQLSGAVSTGLFGQLFGELQSDVTFQDLFKLDAGYEPDAAKNLDVKISALVGTTTLTFAGGGSAAPVRAAITANITRPDSNADSYTLSVTITASITGLTATASSLTGDLRLYEQVFGALQTKLTAVLSDAGLEMVNADEYIGAIREWFNGLSPADRAALISGGSSSQLSAPGVTIGTVAGASFTLSYGNALSINVSVSS
ncbi:MAG: S-layer homology domain-containing protein [Oscillospiraceae bacterium]|jgi:hypothetical protein|nr:S-layer homology domain-containing protein [Oscillospiraceae bacterium]